MNEASRYPLSWPAGWKRTAAHQRTRAGFSKHVRGVNTATGQVVTAAKVRPLTIPESIRRLSGELARLGAVNEVLSTNVQTRLDGLPRAGEPQPKDPGAACYFRLRGKDVALACDKWDRVEDNIAAIAQHIDALRRIDRYGVGTLDQAFAGYAALPPTEADWPIVLGISPTATAEQVREAHRRLAAEHHPDRGGDPMVMAKINAARDRALKATT